MEIELVIGKDTFIVRSRATNVDILLCEGGNRADPKYIYAASMLRVATAIAPYTQKTAAEIDVMLKAKVANKQL